jgi:hypothetical protein
MFSVLSPLKIISFILAAYAVCAGIAVYTVSHFHLSNKEAYSAVAVIATVYDILLLLFVYFAWRKLWKAVPWLSSLLFPDLNGEWEMIIFYQSPENNGVAKARASIRQTFLSISIEVDADGSDSETLSVQQKKDPESGRPLLYYVFRVVPKMRNGRDTRTYEGAAILKFFEGRSEKLSGNYFTNRNTQGHYELTRA